MIKGAIFDLGGTLLQLQGNLTACEADGAKGAAAWLIKKTRIKYDVDALAQAILTCRQDGLAAANETLKEFKMSDGIIEALWAIDAPGQAETFVQEATRRFFQKEEDRHSLIPHAIEILKTLHAKNLKVGLLSNATDDALIQRMVNRFGLRPWLSPVFSSAGLGWKKPKAEPFLLIAGRWGLLPEEIIVIGDTLFTDILGAQNAGMHNVLVTYIENRDNDSHRNIIPDVTIGTLAELPAAIETLSML